MTDSEYRWAPLTDRLSDQERDEQIEAHIAKAHEHARAALELLYGVGITYRGFWYQIALGRAQSTLIKLLNKELKRRKELYHSPPPYTPGSEHIARPTLPGKER